MDKRHSTVDKLAKGSIGTNLWNYKQVVELERELRLARQWAEKLQTEKQQLREEVEAYELQRQDAVEALAAYQQRVQAHEQQLQSQLRQLCQHNATLSGRLQQLQLEHSPCAAFRTAGLQAARERDRLWEDLSATQSNMQKLQQQLADLQKPRSAGGSPTGQNPARNTQDQLQQQQQQQDGTEQQQQQQQLARGWSWRWWSSRQSAQDDKALPPAPSAAAVAASSASLPADAWIVPHADHPTTQQPSAPPAAAAPAVPAQVRVPSVLTLEAPESLPPPAAPAPAGAAAAAQPPEAGADAGPSNLRDTSQPRRQVAAPKAAGGIRKNTSRARARRPHTRSGGAGGRGVAATARALLCAPADWLAGLYQKLEGATPTDLGFGFAA